MTPHYYEGFASFSSLAYDSTDGDMDVFVLAPSSDIPLGASKAWSARWSPLFLNLAMVGEATLVANEHLGIEITVAYDYTPATSSGHTWSEGTVGESQFVNTPGVTLGLQVVDVMNPTHVTVADGEQLQWADGWNLQIPFSYHWDPGNPLFRSSIYGDGTSGYVTALVVKIVDAPSANVTISGSFGWRTYGIAPA